MNVRAAVVRAGVAPATLNERREIPLEARVRDVETPVRRVDRGVTRDARRIDAVKGVGTCCDAREQVLRLRNTQEVAGTILA